MVQCVSILGSTGSIGRQSLDIIPVRLLAEAGGIAVDAHAAVRDQLLSLAAGDAGAARQNFLQSFFHTILLFCG